MKKEKRNDAEKKPLAEKLAEKALNDPRIAQSLAVHEAAFGPILTPAFAGSAAARVHLINALNHLSRRDVKEGIKLLEKIKPACENDADFAAWNFFMGLACELAQGEERMISYYTEAGRYHHAFYLPYLKLALYWHTHSEPRKATECYGAGLSLLSEENERERATLASSLVGYASCLVCIHQYERAEDALSRSARLMPTLAGREGTYALLYAAQGRREEAEQMLDRLAPALAAQTRENVEQILLGKHPQFSALPMEPEEMAAFWNFFLEKADALDALEDVECVQARRLKLSVQHRLESLFPFMHRELSVRIARENGELLLEVRDYDVTALTEGYRALFACCPETLRSRWRFEIVR